MNKHYFSEDDKTKLINFLNMVAQHSKFEMNTEELIKYFKLLNYMQTVFIPKLDANILEVIKVVDSRSQEQKSE